MPGIKELIETFCKKFQKTTLRMTFYTEGHDLLDTGDSRKVVEDYRIDRICGELLELPWHPGRVFEEDDIEPRSGEQREAYTLAQMDEFDRFIPFEQAEFDKLPHFTANFFGKDPKIDRDIHDKRRALRPLFSERFPRIIVNCGPARDDKSGAIRYLPARALDAYRLATERMPTILAIEDKAKRIGAFKSYVMHAASWGDSPGPAYVETLREYRHRESEEIRKELEAEAGVLATKHKCNVSSMKFIAVLHRELDRHRTRREGLREDGLCATAYPGSMAGVEQWYEMNDDVSGEISRVHEILDWLKGACPLLWAQYQERKLRRKEAKK